MQEAKQIRLIYGNSISNIVEAWDWLVSNVSVYGEKVSPRGMPTREISNITYDYNGRNYQYTFYNPVRNLNPVYANAELFYFLNKRDDDLRESYIKRTSEYKNPDTNRYDGSYEELSRWLPHIISILRKDPDTRRAVLTTLRFDHITNVDRTRDFPCNDIFRWAIRDGALDMNVVTRSQDLFVGWLYNTLGFTLLHTMLAKALELDIGRYCHHIFSLHLYEKDVENAVASIGKTEIDTRKPELVDWSVNKFWETVRLMNGVLEFPALFGSQYSGFQDDLVTAIQMYKLRHRKFAPVGVYSHWVDRWLKGKAEK